MRFLFAVTYTVSTIFSANVDSAEIPTPRPHVFTAKVANVRLSARLLSQGKKPEDMVSISVPAIIFAQPMEIGDVRSANTHSMPEVDTVIRYMKANIDGNVQVILSFWLPEERAEKSKLLSQPSMFQANRDYFTKNPGLSVIGLVFQTRTTSVLIKRPAGALGVTLVKKDGRLYLTDHPSNDLELAIIEASFFAH